MTERAYPPEEAGLHKIKIKRILVFAILLLVSMSKVCGFCLGPAVPLRFLIEQSPCIVIAKVVKKKEKSEYPGAHQLPGGWMSFTPDSVETGEAYLYIIEILKGKLIDNQHVKVHAPFGRVCPPPPCYNDGETVIAFLYKQDSDKIYETFANGYGCKMLNEKGLKAYKARINEYLNIMKIQDSLEWQKSTIAWLVDCASNKYTCQEGVYELSPHYSHVSKFWWKKEAGFENDITESQRNQLSLYLFAADTLSIAEIRLSDLIAGRDYPKLKINLLKNLSFCKEDIAPDIMAKLLEINPNSKLQAICEEAERIDYNDENRNSEMKQLSARFILEAGQ